MRFNKIIEREDAGDVLYIIDKETQEKVITMEGNTILKMVSDLGEEAAWTSIVSVVETKYPKLSRQELEEIFA